MTWPKSRRSVAASWIVIGAVVLVSLGRAAFDDGPPRTTEEQVEAIARTLKCPVCGSQSVADSDVAASRAIRAEIARLVEEGQSPTDVRAAIGASFGEQVQLDPARLGLRGPGVDPAGRRPHRRAGRGVGRAGAMAPAARSTPSDDDRALVEQALRER